MNIKDELETELQLVRKTLLFEKLNQEQYNFYSKREIELLNEIESILE